jgi:hypothetical protein
MHEDAACVREKELYDMLHHAPVCGMTTFSAWLWEGIACSGEKEIFHGVLRFGVHFGRGTEPQRSRRTTPEGWGGTREETRRNSLLIPSEIIHLARLSR